MVYLMFRQQNKNLSTQILRWFCTAGLYMLLNITSFAQQSHFTQYFNAPLENSPSNAGRINEDIRFGTIYRSQWMNSGSDITTSSAFFDMNFEGGKLNDKKIGISLSVIDDELLKDYLNRREANFNASIHAPLDGMFRNNLSFGLGVNYNQLSLLGPEQYLWGNEFDHFNRPQSLTNAQVGEDYNTSSLSSLNINAGLGYSRRISKTWEGVFTYGVYNVNRSIQTFYNSTTIIASNRRRWRNVLTLMFVHNLSNTITFEPSLLWSLESGARNSIGGFRLGMQPNKMNENIKLYLGPWYRIGALKTQNLENAILLYSGFQIKNVEVGLSYDITISDLNNVTDAPQVVTQNMRAWELSLIYKGVLKRPFPNDYTIPCKFF
jgi:type IX secretion system PorP/SprF family membrane protein